MTTNSDAYFARELSKTLKEKHPDFLLERVKGRRIGLGVGGVRVIQITHSGGRFAQFPFPAKGLHTGEVHRRLYASFCQMLSITPVPENPDEPSLEP